MKKNEKKHTEVNEYSKDKDLLPVKAEIRKHNGTSTLFVNDELLSI